MSTRIYTPRRRFSPVRKRPVRRRLPFGLSWPRLIALLLDGLLFIWFALPLFKGIFNPGNAVGLLFTACVGAVFLFWSFFLSVVRRMSASLWGKAVLGIVSGCLAFFLGLAVWLGIEMIAAMGVLPSSTENAPVIVLGARVYGSHPGLMLERRLDAAAEYLLVHENTAVVVSGGQGANESIEEAEVMAWYLEQKGVSPQRIYKEPASTSTEENIQFSRSVLLREGLISGDGPHPVVIITDGFHQKRAAVWCERMGFAAMAVSSETPWYLLPTFVLREEMALVAQWLLNW